MDNSPALGQDIEHTVSNGLSGFFGCGTSFFTLLLMLAISLFANYYLIKVVVDMLKDARAKNAAIKEVTDANN